MRAQISIFSEKASHCLIWIDGKNLVEEEANRPDLSIGLAFERNFKAESDSPMEESVKIHESGTLRILAGAWIKMSYITDLGSSWRLLHVTPMAGAKLRNGLYRRGCWFSAEVALI